MPRKIAIGDIHGCLAPLDAILSAIGPTKDDVIVTVGDYVDRGPDSKGVIERLMQLNQSTQLFPLMGNHEEMMLAVLNRTREPFGWINHGGLQTMESYGFSGDLSVIPQNHKDFLTNLLPFYESDTHFVVHANYDPQMRLENQSIEFLRWMKLTERMPRPHFSGKHAIVGHTHNRNGEIVQAPHLTCIDTHCYGGKWLTALDWTCGHVWQANLEGDFREFDLEPFSDEPTSDAPAPGAAKSNAPSER
jgi:serine/threonine protein phosphatase 1